MDPSIKKKPEKPRMRPTEVGKWLCHDREVFILDLTGTQAYQEWQRTRAALNKHEGKQ